MKIALLKSSRDARAVLTVRTVSAILLADVAAKGDTPASVESWIQVAKVGTFKNYYVGNDKKTLVITKKMLRQMSDNFSEGKHPVDPTEIAVDFEHKSADPQDVLDGVAAGWYRELELRADDSELWARIEWTDDAAGLIKAKKLKYFSPEFAFDYETHDDEHLGCTLLAGALTNRPFLQGMSPVELRAGSVKLTDLSHDQKRMFLAEAIREYYEDSGLGGYPYIAAVYDDAVVFCGPNSQYYRAGYTIAPNGDVALDTNFTEVIGTWTPLEGAADVAARIGGSNMAKEVKIVNLTDRGGKAVEIDAALLESTEIVSGLRAELAARPTKADHDAALAERVTLKASVDTLTTENATLKAAATKRDATIAVDALLKAGKITAGQKDGLVELHQTNKALFDKVTATAKASVQLGEVGSAAAGGDGEGDDDVKGETPMDEIVKMADAEVAKDPKLARHDAISRVIASVKGRKLYDRHVSLTTGKAAPAATAQDSGE